MFSPPPKSDIAFCQTDEVSGASSSTTAPRPPGLQPSSIRSPQTLSPSFPRRWTRTEVISPTVKVGTFREHDGSFSLRILTGNSNPKLAEDVANIVGYEMRRTDAGQVLTPCRFANGEISINLLTCVRGDDVYVVQPTCGSVVGGGDVNTSIVELLILIHALRLASCSRLTVVVPYYAYGRQSEQRETGMPIGASAVSKLMLTMKVDQVVTVDLHRSQIQGFFHNVPVENLSALPVFGSYLLAKIKSGQLSTDHLAVVALGGSNVARAKKLGDMLGIWRFVTILTRRTEIVMKTPAGNEWKMEKTMQLDSSSGVAGLICITVDDTLDTGGTTVKAARMLKEAGAEYTISCATHGLFSGNCIELINECEALRELIVTDTTPQGSHMAACGKLTVLTIAPLLGLAIERLHNEEADQDDEWATEEWYKYDWCSLPSGSPLSRASPKATEKPVIPQH